jgi:oligosaccharide repeat unit polymerase
MGALARPSGATWPVAALVAAILAALLTMDAQTVAVAAPLTATLVSTLGFLLLLARRRRGDVVWFELGLVYVGVVTVYAVYPLVGFLILGQKYTTYSDLRLQQIAPDAALMGRVGWLYVAHLLAFVVCYIGGRGRLPLGVARPQSPSVSVGVAALAFYLAIWGFSIVLGWFYDTAAESYIESYLVARRLPLFVAQVAGHLNGAQYPLAITLLVLLFSRYPRTRPILLAWLAVTGIVTAMRLGNRTEFALFAFAIAITYHSLVRRISVRFMTVGAVAGLTGFIAFGIVRSGAAGVSGQPWYVMPFSMSSEFEVLFANAVHLDWVLASGVDLRLPAFFYLQDLTALLPQQVAPYTKFDPSSWYVTTFFPEYAAAGGGLAFGVIPESLLTGGWVSAAGRGAMLGLLFAAVHRLYVRRADRFWVFVFYVWVTTLSYQAFRASTLYLLVPFVYRFVVMMLAVKVTAAMLDLATRAPRGARTAPGSSDRKAAGRRRQSSGPEA